MSFACTFAGDFTCAVHMCYNVTRKHAWHFLAASQVCASLQVRN